MQVNLLLRREVAYADAHGGALTQKVLKQIEDYPPALASPRDVTQALRVWASLREYRTEEGVQNYMNAVDRSKKPLWEIHGWLPWLELKQMIRALPTEL